ncbi:MAG: DUF4384 domain-containing protein [Bacteroidales bacterium]|nr:DUF4384 domain-containing protein [Bacteroidales bacterium]
MFKLFTPLIWFISIHTFVLAEIQDNKNVLHSAIVEANGYAYLSEDKLIKDIREEAKSNAKREALENGMTYIQSVTRVENLQVEYDLIESTSEGFITVLESKDLGITEDNRYHVWIRAELQYKLQKPELQIVNTNNGPLAIQIWTDKDIYKIGDQIKVFLKSNKDCYVRVLYRSSDNQLLQLLPNPLRSDNLCRSTVVVHIPDNNDKFQLEVIPPCGREEIIVMASTEQLGEIELDNFDKGLYISKDNIKSISQKTRGIQIRPVENQEIKAGEFIEIQKMIIIE